MSGFRGKRTLPSGLAESCPPQGVGSTSNRRGRRSWNTSAVLARTVWQATNDRLRTGTDKGNPIV